MVMIQDCFHRSILNIMFFITTENTKAQSVDGDNVGKRGGRGGTPRGRGRGSRYRGRGRGGRHNSSSWESLSNPGEDEYNDLPYVDTSPSAQFIDGQAYVTPYIGFGSYVYDSSYVQVDETTLKEYIRTQM